MGKLAWFIDKDQFGEDTNYIKAEKIRILQIILGYGYFLFHGSIFWGWINMALFVSIAILVSTTNEIIGSKYGLIFGGKYHYDQTLTPGPMIYNIPLLIPIVWSGLIYMGYSYSSFLTDQIITVDSFISGMPLIIATGLLLVVLDMVLDPIAVDEKRWSWEFPGVYYGIPLLNFFGWFLTVAIILSIFFLIHIPVNDHNGTSFLFKYSPSIFFAILPAIAARPCYERGLKVPGHIGLSLSAILIVGVALRYINM